MDTITSSERALQYDCTRSKPALKMFFACEDKASFLRARAIRRQVKSVCGDDIEIQSVFWNFALLRHDALQEWAVSEAATADMIVISLRAENELPTHVKYWIEHLPARADDGQTALVALLGAGRSSWRECHGDVAYLREIAASRGFDFFCNQDGGQEIGRMPLMDLAEELVCNN